MTVERGVPDVDEVVSLLNNAYDGWGTKELFEWRYDNCPDYDPEEHTFHILEDDELAAFRRVTFKELITSDRIMPLYVLGDTAVAPEHQGKGLYSQLHEETTTYCAEDGVTTVFTFNRKGNITYKANKKRGWSYRELPLHLCILSPSAVIPNYAQLIVEDSKWLQKVIRMFGPRIALKMSDGQIALGELDGISQDIKKPNITLHISDAGVKRLVEVASNDASVKNLLTTGISLLRGGDISFWNTSQSITFDEPDFDFEIDRTETGEFSNEELEEVLTLYTSFLSKYDLSFRRNRIDLNHMLSHPELVEVLRVRNDGALVGFAPIAFHPANDANELRVLDFVYTGKKAVDAMITQIQQTGIEYGADFISVFSTGALQSQWASIQKQVIMWDRISESVILEDNLSKGKWHFGFYDVA